MEEIHGIHEAYNMQIMNINAGWQHSLNEMQMRWNETHEELSRVNRELREVKRERNLLDNKVMDLEETLNEYESGGQFQPNAMVNDSASQATTVNAADSPLQIMAQLQEKQTELDALTCKYEETKKELDAAEEAKANLIAASAELQKDVDKAETRDKDRRDMIARLKLDNSKNKALIDMQKESMERTSKDATHNANLRAQLRDEVQSYKSEIRQLKADLEASRKEAVAYAADLDAFRNAERSKRDGNIYALQKENRDLLANIKNSALELEKVKKEKEFQDAHYEQKNNELNAEIKSLETQIMECCSHHEKEMDTMHLKCADLSRLLASANCRVVELETVTNNRSKEGVTQGRINALNKECDRYRKRMEEYGSKVSELQDALVLSEARAMNNDEYRKQLESLGDELNEAKAVIISRESDIKELAAAKEDLEENMEKVKSEYEEKEKVIQLRLSNLEEEERKVSRTSTLNENTAEQLRRSIVRLRDQNVYVHALETEVSTTMHNLNMIQRAYVVVIRHMFTLYHKDDDVYESMLSAIRYEMEIAAEGNAVDVQDFINKLKENCTSAHKHVPETVLKNWKAFMKMVGIKCDNDAEAGAPMPIEH